LKTKIDKIVKNFFKFISIQKTFSLGKTCQTIAFFAHIYETNPNALNLIVVPASTLDNWTREIRMWFPK